MDDWTPLLAALGTGLPVLLVCGRLAMQHGRAMTRADDHAKRIGKLEDAIAARADERSDIRQLFRDVERIDKERRSTHDRLNDVHADLHRAEGLLSVLDDRDRRPPSWPPTPPTQGSGS